MKLTWLGHSCFLLEQDGYKLVVDPYKDVEGYPELHVEAHGAFCSHHHFDHDAIDRVTWLPGAKSPFTIREIETCHDDQGGTLRGENVVRVFTAGDVSVAHLGDLGHLPTEEQLAAIGKVDGVLVPIGGTYTVTADAAKQVCDAIAPKWVIPMHYRHGSYNFRILTDVEAFLRLWPEEEVHCLPGAEVELTPELSGVVVPTYGI